jgi:hypothetical protein
VYTVFQQSSWGGQLVVTQFVRAFVSNQTLFIEVTVCALRPLRRLFYTVRGLSVRPPVEFISVAGQALADALPLLIASPGQLLRRKRRHRAQLIAARYVEREIRGKRDVDFGASRSLREEAASEDLADHFASMDEQMMHQTFNRRVLECIGEFLESKDVDLSEFRIQQNLIMLRTTATTRTINAAATSAGTTAFVPTSFVPTQGGAGTGAGSGADRTFPG